jgi:hypothetical protein
MASSFFDTNVMQDGMVLYERLRIVHPFRAVGC